MAPVALDSTPALDVFRVPAAASLEQLKSQARPKYEPPNRKLEDVHIRSNSGPMNAQNMGWLQPVYAESTSMDEMCDRFMDQGYPWVKGLIQRSDILEFRRKYFEFMKPTGVLREGTEPIEGTYCGEDPETFLPPGNGRYCHGHGAEKAEQFIQHRSDFLAEISEHPAMVNFVKEFTNWPAVKLLKRQMLRRTSQALKQPYAVHYDHIFLRYGPPAFLTGWLPFGDIAVKGGGLTYLENSVLLAQSVEDDFTRHAETFTPDPPHLRFVNPEAPYDSRWTNYWRPNDGLQW